MPVQRPAPEGPGTPQEEEEDQEEGISKILLYPILAILGLAYIFDRAIFKKLIYPSVFLLVFLFIHNREKMKEHQKVIPFDKLPEEVQTAMKSDNIPIFDPNEGEVIETEKGTQITQENGFIKIK